LASYGSERDGSAMVAAVIGGANLNVGKLMQARIWIGILVGSSIGSFIPELWGAGLLSYSSILFSGIGAFVGLLISYKLA
jgi:hypothetical protein